MKRLSMALVVAALAALHPPAAERADEAALTVGFAEADVTPKVGGDKTVFVAGFGHNRKATGVHDPLKARAVVLSDGTHKVALVGVDLVGFFRPDVLKVRAALPGFAYVLVGSTHNHEGPDTLGLWGPTPLQSGVDPDYLDHVRKQIVAAVKAADAARKPATARCGAVNAPELLHDGRLPVVLHDELTALRFDAPDGKPLGLVVNWHCHPETLDSKNTLISADFVGYAVAALEKRHGCPVVYLTGTVGGLMTSLKVDVRSPDGQPLKDGTYEKTERYGVLLADAADKALKAAKPAVLTPFDVRTRPLYLPIDNKVYLLARQLGVFDREAFVWAGDPDKAEPAVDPKPEQRLAMQTEIGYLRLGAVEVAAIPGEIYPELVLGKVQDPADPAADFPDAPVEPSIYGALKGPHRMLFGLANDEIGYVIPKRQWDEKPPFCYGRKASQYGEINSLGPDTAPLLCAAFRALVGGK